MTNSEGPPRPSILVALDGSPAAAAALPTARAVAGQLGAVITLVHVAREPMAGDERREYLDLERDRREGESLRHLTNREPAEGILETAKDLDAALIVLTTHGAAEPEHGLGPVAEKVIAQAALPVLLVRPEAMTGAHGYAGALKRLLIPVDGAPGTARALKPALVLAVRLGASVDLLYVAAPLQTTAQEPGSIRAPRYVDQPQHEWPQWSNEVIDRLIAYADCPACVPMQMYLVLGEPAREITRFAREHGEDAIVLVRQSRLEPGRAAVLRAVLDQAPCPLLIIGAPAPR